MPIERANAAVVARRCLFGAAGLLLAFGAQAQLVVTSCGSISPSLTAGKYAATQYMDVNGNLCVGANVTATATTTATAAATPTPVLAGAGNPLVMNLFSALYTQPTYGSGVPVDLTHGLPVNVVAGGAGTSSNFGSAFPSAGTAMGLSDGTNMKSWLAAIALADGVNGNNTGAVAGWYWNGTTYDRARGDLTNGAYVNVKAGGVQLVDSAGTNKAAISAGGAVKVDNSAVTQPVSGSVSPIPTTSGGLSVFSAIVPNNTTSFVIKASPGQLYGLEGFSIAATIPVWLKTYDVAQGSVTCGSGTPKARYLIPASGGAPGSGLIPSSALGDAYGTAITGCITAGIADNDTTAPAASSYTLNVHYK